MSITEQPEIEEEKIESLKKAISKLQEDLTVQKTITETVSERNLKLEAEIQQLTKTQSVIEEKVDDMTTMFRTTFANLIKESAETIKSDVKKATRNSGENPKGLKTAKEAERVD